MQLLKAHNLPFGISTCYTSANYKDITSEEFYDMIIEAGALFIWFFHYMPVGNDAAPELMPNPEQRKAVYERIRAFRSSKPIFSLDFQTMPNISVDVSQAAAITCISMQREM